MYLLIDANAAPGKSDGLAVGDRPFSDSKNTELFRNFLATHQLCLPCSFDCHVGTTTTWYGPDGVQTACIDFVCVPCTDLPRCTHSAVLEDFDLGNADLDHRVVALQLQWLETTWVDPAPVRLPAIDRAAISASALSEPLRAFAVPSWDTDIETHIGLQTAHYQECLVQTCARRKQEPKKSFISQEIWTMRNAKPLAKKRLTAIGRRQGTEALRFCFQGRIDQVTQHELWRDNLASFCQTHLRLDPTDIPSLTDLETALRRVQRNKATGPDHLRSELCCACPTLLARQLYGALLKLVLHGQESLTHKGGTLVPAHKGRGSTLEASSYRSLLVSSHIGKALHRTVRQTQAALLEAYMGPQQLCGKRHVPVQLGLHEVRSFLRGAQHRSRSVAILMVDLTEAFYRVLRSLSVGTPSTDLEVAALARRLNLEPAVMHQLHQHLSEPSAIEQVGMKPHYRNVLKALHCDTFFKLPGQSDQTRTTIGSRLGDSFADIVFTFLFSRVLQYFQEKVQAHELQEYVAEHEFFDPFGHGGQSDEPVAPYQGPVWMDDLAICISGTTGEALHRASVTTSLLLETLEEHAMSPNLKPGKTELLVLLRGPGVRALKTRVFGPCSSRTIPVGERKIYDLVVVGQYRHLGGVMHHGGDLRCEVRRRVAMAHQAFNESRKAIFHNPKIDFMKKVQLFQTLVLSRLLYGCESWILRAWKHKQALHAAVIKLYKRLLKLPPDATLTDEAVCVAVNLPTPTELLRRARLRYLGTLHRCAYTVTWSVLHSDSEWCAMIRDDLCWMWHQLSGATSLRNPEESIDGWRYLWHYHGGYWKGLIKRACTHACLQRQNEYVVTQAHRNIMNILEQQQRVDPAALPCQAPAMPTSVFGCLACEKRFRSRAGEGAHMFKCHGIISNLRWLFDGTACPACLREYHSAGRLKEHLRRSATCRRDLQNRPPLPEPAAGFGSQVHEDQERALSGLLPPQPGAGPHLCPVRHRDIVEFDSEVYADLVEALSQQDMDENKLAAVQRAVQQRPISWTLFVQTLDYAKENADLTDAQASFRLCFAGSASRLFQ
eukprot:s676_g23.t1